VDKKNFAIITFVLILMALFVVPVNAEGTVCIDVLVVDAISGNPLAGSTVIFIEENNINKQIAGADGHCRFTAFSNRWYNILVFNDDPATPGRDYVPSVFTAYLPEKEKRSLKMQY